MQKVVLFVFYDKSKNKFLAERNPPSHPYYPNITTFPGGKVETGEKLEETLIREIKEELNVEVKNFIKLGGEIKSIKGENLLYPFLITNWLGQIPEKVLDKNVPLVWESFEEIISSPVLTRPVILNRAKKFI